MYGQMSDFRRLIQRGLSELLEDDGARFHEVASRLVSPDSVWDFAHPLDRAVGRDNAVEAFFEPLRRSLSHVRRRDEIFIGGTNIRSSGGTWVASLCHYVGTFRSSLFGVAPNGRLVFLRSGEFYRIEDGAIVEAKILFDLPDLARQCGRLPFARKLGTEMLFPGPATHDGVLPSEGDGAESIALVQAMLSDLHVYDPDTGASAGQTGHDGRWHDDMLWYGPGGIGSTYRWQGFVDDHRSAFLSAFPDRKGGNHFCRLGDGNYAAVSGWPSMTMTHSGPYLDVPPTGANLTLRVMDFYRCDFTSGRGKIAENWVCLDYGDLFHQMGVDLIAKGNELD